MKNFSLMLIAIAILPAGALAQSLPPAPLPAETPVPMQSTSVSTSPIPVGLSDATWIRFQQIANGQEVLVTNTYGPPLRCRFAGATDAYLFCDPPGTPEGTGYRFERASVINVVVVRPPRNWHPGVLSAMIAGGIITGIGATAYTDAGHAAGVGFIGALVTGAIASPFVLLPPPNMNAGLGAGIAFRPHGFTHGRHLFLPFRR
jgi:hypothetical protein